MFSVIMIPRIRAAVFVLCAASLTVACQKVPLLAPSGSTITLTSAATALSVNGTADIIAQVIQASGTSPQQGTLVIFTTTLGSIQPSQAETDVSGRVVVKFVAGNASGTANITASSGGANQGANGAIKILIGTAAVARVTVNASPASVPAQGGTTRISATVIDVNGNALVSAPVSFSTTAGTLSATAVTTDANGVAATMLTTSQQADVTASVGSGSAAGTTTSPAGQSSNKVTVTVLGAPTLVITAPTTALSAGLPASFTFAVTAAAANSSAVRDVTVDWGDGQTKDLGAITGSVLVAHVYGSPGTYNISGTLTDSSGNVVNVSISVTVNPKPQPAVSISTTTTNPTVGTDITFTASVAAGTAATGTVIQDVTINWGDGNSTDLGPVTGTAIALHHVYQKSDTYTVRLAATDSNGGVGTAVTTVFVQAATPLTVLLSATSTPAGTSTVETFTATVIGLGNSVVVNYHWTFGSTLGSADTSGNQVTRTYPPMAGTITVTVTITTSNGATQSGQTVIVVP